MKSCMLTGSFDPFTVGHFDLMKRVVGKFDRVYVAVLVNPVKKYTFTVKGSKLPVNIQDFIVSPSQGS